jgi:hypothetical protein
MGNYTTIQVKRELYKELHNYCCENGYSKSGLVEILIKRKLGISEKGKPSNVLRVKI